VWTFVLNRGEDFVPLQGMLTKALYQATYMAQRGEIEKPEKISAEDYRCMEGQMVADRGYSDYEEKGEDEDVEMM